MTLICEECKTHEATLIADDARVWCQRCEVAAARTVQNGASGPCLWRIGAMRAFLLTPTEDWVHVLILRDPRYPLWAEKLGLPFPPPLVMPPPEAMIDDTLAWGEDDTHP